MSEWSPVSPDMADGGTSLAAADAVVAETAQEMHRILDMYAEYAAHGPNAAQLADHARWCHSQLTKATAMFARAVTLRAMVIAAADGPAALLDVTEGMPEAAPPRVLQ